MKNHNEWQLSPSATHVPPALAPESQNPAQPFRNLAAWARVLQQEPALKDHQLELGIMSEKLDDAHDVFFSLGEMMTIWRSAGLLGTHPEFTGAFVRAQTAYRAARGEPLPNLPETDEASNAE